MEIRIKGLQLRALTGRLCDFLSNTKAIITENLKDNGIDVIINSSAFIIDFQYDERPITRLAVVINGNKYTYLFDNADYNTITLM